jgi:hypothetical protein
MVEQVEAGSMEPALETGKTQAIKVKKKTGAAGWSAIFATWTAVAGAGWGGVQWLAKYDEEIKRSEDSHVVQTFALYDSFNRGDMLRIRERMFNLPVSAFEVRPEATLTSEPGAETEGASAAEPAPAAEPEAEQFASADLFVYVDFFDAVQVCVERALCNADLVDRLLKPYAEYDLLKERINVVREGEKDNNRRHVFGEGIEWIATVDLQACATARETEPEAACVASPAEPAAPTP